MPNWTPEYWIALRTDDTQGAGAIIGSGTLADPWGARVDPTGGLALGDKYRLDKILRSSSYLGSVTNAIIHILPGTYQTAGVYEQNASIGFRVLSGWQLQGAGINKTTIQLAEITNNFNVAISTWFEASVTDLKEDITITDLTVDCNKPAFSGSNTIQGVMLFGNRLRVERVRVIKAVGQRVSSPESFIISLGRRNGNGEGFVIRDCEVSGFVAGECTAIGFISGPASPPYTGWENPMVSGVMQNNRVYLDGIAGALGFSAVWSKYLII